MTSSRWSRGRIARTILRFCSTRLARRRSRSRLCGRIIRVCSSASRRVSPSPALLLTICRRMIIILFSIIRRLRRDRLYGTPARAALDADVPRDGHHADRMDCACLQYSYLSSTTFAMPNLLLIFLSRVSYSLGYMRSRPVRLPPALPSDSPRA